MADKQNHRSRVGRSGEDLAAAYLVSEAGHAILSRNWRTGHLELDIVSMAADGIHFVEVKSRVFPMEAEPQESVDASKRRKMVSAAIKWLKKNGIDDAECSFDVVSVVFKGDEYRIDYFPQAFIPIIDSYNINR